MHSHSADLIRFAFSLVAGLLAFWMGKWRATRIFWNLTSPVNVPPAWRLAWVRVCSWVLVTALSLTFATLWASLVTEYFNDWLGVFSWGLCLFFRWDVSGLAGFYRYHKEKTQIEQLKGAPIIDVRIEQLKAYDAYLVGTRTAGGTMTTEKSSLSLVAYYLLYFLVPLAVTILPPAHGAWWVPKIIGGLTTLLLFGGYLTRLEAANDLLGDAAGGFLYVAGGFALALAFRNSAFGVFMFLLCVYLISTLYPLVLKRQRQRSARKAETLD